MNKLASGSLASISRIKLNLGPLYLLYFLFKWWPSIISNPAMLFPH